MHVRTLPIFVLLMIPIFAPAEDLSSRRGVQLQSLNEIVDQYLEFREGVWRMSPPIHQAEDKTEFNEKTTTWFEAAWTRWLIRPGWFMRFTASAGTLSPKLQNAIWPEGHTGSLLVWEHPGQGRVYLSLENPHTGEPEELLQVKSPDWTLRSSETGLQFYERELATRRVVWTFQSPYAEPEPEPEPRMMMMGGGPPEFRVDWTTASGESGPSGVQVDFGQETSPGPFTVWRHATGDLTATPGLPGDWIPMSWMRDRPAEQIWEISISLAEHPNPGFVRATLGIIDSDMDGLDDGFELWFFEDLTQTAQGDFDQDGLSNLAEYQQNTDPTLTDTDADGLKDGDEHISGTNPLWRDHPDVELEVHIVY